MLVINRPATPQNAKRWPDERKTDIPALIAFCRARPHMAWGPILDELPDEGPIGNKCDVMDDAYESMMLSGVADHPRCWDGAAVADALELVGEKLRDPEWEPEHA